MLIFPTECFLYSLSRVTLIMNYFHSSCNNVLGMLDTGSTKRKKKEPSTSSAESLMPMDWSWARSPKSEICRLHSWRDLGDKVSDCSLSGHQSQHQASCLLLFCYNKLKKEIVVTGGLWGNFKSPESWKPSCSLCFPVSPTVEGSDFPFISRMMGSENRLQSYVLK